MGKDQTFHKRRGGATLTDAGILARRKEGMNVQLDRAPSSRKWSSVENVPLEEVFVLLDGNEWSVVFKFRSWRFRVGSDFDAESIF